MWSALAPDAFVPFRVSSSPRIASQWRPDTDWSWRKIRSEREEDSDENERINPRPSSCGWISQRVSLNVPRWAARNKSNPRSCERLVRSTLCPTSPPKRWPGIYWRVQCVEWLRCKNVLLQEIGLLTYEENGDPGESNVIKRDRALKGVSAELCAISVVLIPINTWLVCGNIRWESNRRRCE